MATYEEIQDYVSEHFGYVPEPCWIADVKRQHGLTNRTAHNRIDPDEAAHNCPTEKVPDIESALRHFGML